MVYTSKFVVNVLSFKLTESMLSL